MQGATGYDDILAAEDTYEQLDDLHIHCKDSKTLVLSSLICNIHDESLGWIFFGEGQAVIESALIMV